MTSETPNLHVSKNLNISKTKQDTEKLKTPLRLVWKCCSDAFKIGPTIFRRRGTLTFQAIHGLAPKYLCELARIKEQSSYHLRSSEEIILLQPSEKSLTRHGDRAFQFAAPRLWNRLPRDLKLLNSIGTFKTQLKTYLFIIAYDIT